MCVRGGEDSGIRSWRKDCVVSRYLCVCVSVLWCVGWIEGIHRTSLEVQVVWGGGGGYIVQQAWGGGGGYIVQQGRGRRIHCSAGVGRGRRIQCSAGMGRRMFNW